MDADAQKAAGSTEKPEEGVPQEELVANQFEQLEVQFQEVLQELVGDKSLEHFRIEYEKLHRALKKSHESEKRLVRKLRELNQEIVSNSERVSQALVLAQEDQSTIGSRTKKSQICFIGRSFIVRSRNERFNFEKYLLFCASRFENPSPGGVW